MIMVKSIEDRIIKASLKMLEFNLVSRTWGNVSARDNESFYITPSGADYRRIRSNQIVKINLKDGSFEKDKIPSSERLLHRAIYNSRKSANWIFHTHQYYGTAISLLGDIINNSCKNDRIYNNIEFEKIKKWFYKRHILFAEYGLSASDKLTMNVKNTLSEIKSEKDFECATILLAHHGVVSWGKSENEVLAELLRVEQMCKEFLVQNGVKEYNIDKREKEIHKEGNNTVIKISLSHQFNFIDRDKNEEKDICMPKRVEVFTDDCAQIVGKKMLLDKDEIVIELENKEDYEVSFDEIEAIINIACTNLMAAEVAKKFNILPIKDDYIKLMREKYIKSYSKKIFN